MHVKEEDIKDAENLLDAVEFYEDLSSLNLQQLSALQRLIGYAIEEKLNEGSV